VLQRDAAPGIHRVEEAFTNWYLVEDGDRVTIVDTGFPRSWRTLERALAELGRSKDALEAVVLTHGHFDHVGFAERARTELGIPVWIHEREVAVVRHPWRYDHERSRVPYFVRYPKFDLAFLAMGAKGALWVKGLRGASTYRGDAELDVPGRPRVVCTPGHTHGHSSLHFPERNAVIAGDAIVTRDPYTGRRGPQIVSGAATADSAQALASLDALAATGAGTVLTGHGEPWTQGVESAAERARAAEPS
jgi:glyoxylase-like metal-dependent hydrolase (beta-lactamase superfamily II)